MNLIEILWSAVSGACLMLGVLHLLVWFRNRHSWESLFFVIAVLGVIGLAVEEILAMEADTPAVFGKAIQRGHLVYLFCAVGVLGFVHFYFGSGRRWLLVLALGTRLLAVVMNFTTGLNLHIKAIHSLQKLSFFGKEVSVLGEWEPNPWMRLGQLAALVQLLYMVDASMRLWRTGSVEGRRRALFVGGSLSFFILMAAVQAGMVAAGVLRMPFIVSFPFLCMLLAMGYELSQDVFRAARLTEELRTSEKRLILAAAAARLALWEWDMIQDRIWVSETGRWLYSLRPDEGFDFQRFVSSLHEEDRQSVRQAVQLAAKGPEPFATEYRIALPDGELRWMALSGRVERNGQGDAIMLRGVSLDITERKRAELETSHHRRELAHLARVSTLGELAGALAHELNQPLAAILSNSQVGRRGIEAADPDITETSAIFDDITADAKRAGGIIHGMRAMFKNDASAEAESLDLNDAVRQVLHLLHSEIMSRKVRVDFSPDPTLPPVKAHRVEILQVLINLLLNSFDAIKAGNGNGSPLIEIRGTAEDGNVVVSVRDHGSGIAPQMMDRLFEPFASTKSGGLGLGLAISRRIMQSFAGELEAHNHPDGGAVFRLVMPEESRPQPVRKQVKRTV